MTEIIRACVSCGSIVRSTDPTRETCDKCQRQWTYIWMADYDGPDLGSLYPTEEAAMQGAYEEWNHWQGGNLGGWDKGTRAEFDAMYANSGSIWVRPLAIGSQDEWAKWDAGAEPEDPELAQELREREQQI